MRYNVYCFNLTTTSYEFSILPTVGRDRGRIAFAFGQDP